MPTAGEAILSYPGNHGLRSVELLYKRSRKSLQLGEDRLSSPKCPPPGKRRDSPASSWHSRVPLQVSHCWTRERLRCSEEQITRKQELLSRFQRPSRFCEWSSRNQEPTTLSLRELHEMNSAFVLDSELPSLAKEERPCKWLKYLHTAP